MLFEDGGFSVEGGLPHLSFFTYKAKDLVFPAQTDRREKKPHTGCWYFIDLDINWHPNSQILLLIDPDPNQHPRVMCLTISDTVTSENTPDAQTHSTNLFLTAK